MSQMFWNMDSGRHSTGTGFGSRLNTEFIVGMASAGKKMIAILDVDRLAPDHGNGKRTNQVRPGRNVNEEIS